VAKCSAGLQTESLLKQGPEVDSGVHISVVRKKRGLGGSGDKFNDIVWLRRLRSMCGFAKDDLRFAETVSKTGDEDVADRMCQKTPKLTAPPIDEYGLEHGPQGYGARDRKSYEVIQNHVDDIVKRRSRRQDAP
jgi:hypothetical protein